MWKSYLLYRQTLRPIAVVLVVLLVAPALRSVSVAARSFLSLLQRTCSPVLLFSVVSMFLMGYLSALSSAGVLQQQTELSPAKVETAIGEYLLRTDGIAGGVTSIGSRSMESDVFTIAAGVTLIYASFVGGWILMQEAVVSDATG